MLSIKVCFWWGKTPKTDNIILLNNANQILLWSWIGFIRHIVLHHFWVVAHICGSRWPVWFASLDIWNVGSCWGWSPFSSCKPAAMFIAWFVNRVFQARSSITTCAPLVLRHLRHVWPSRHGRLPQAGHVREPAPDHASWKPQVYATVLRHLWMWVALSSHAQGMSNLGCLHSLKSVCKENTLLS